MNFSPPKRALSFLRWLCREDYLEEIEGDLTEVFQKHCEISPTVANRKFIWSVIRYFRPGFIKSFKTTYPSVAMYKNYFTISWRSLVRQKMYSLIKVSGLSLGIAASCLIGLFLRDELSYDKHYPTDVYRVVGVFDDGGQVSKDVYFPAPFGQAVKNDFSEIENVGRYNAGQLHGAGSGQVRRADKLENSHEEGIAFMDQAMLDMLDLPMVYGSRPHALADPRSIVITRSKSEKYFPNEDPVGKLLIVNNDEANPYKIGGVIEDFKQSSHIRYDFLITLTGKEFWPGEQDTWRSSNYPTYVKIKEGTDIDGLASKITKGIVEKYYLPAMMADNSLTEKQIREQLSKGRLELQPVDEIYLTSDVHDGIPHSDKRFVWLFGTIAVFILIIACINFVNLSTAKSANRAKEVGLRKVMGSFRSNIIHQFMTESFLFTIMSFAVGILFAFSLLPSFNVIAAKNISFPWLEWQLLPWLLAAVFAVAILAGVYPSFYLSSFRPIQVLKGNVSRGSKSSGTRSMLVIFQFTTSIILIVSTLVIYRQMQFILNKKLGFNKEQVVLIEGTGTLGKHAPAFKNALLEMQQVKAVSISDYLPVRNTKRNGNPFWIEGHVQGQKEVSGQKWLVDHDYIKTLGMKVVDGRDFDVRMASDSQAYIINQAMVKQLNLQDPVGKRITNGWEPGTVIGVVEDFHFESMKQNIGPLCLALGKSSDIISVKVSTSDLASTLEAVSSVWKQFEPHQPFRYAFLDDRYARMYDDVKRMGYVFTCCAVFAIIVACLGLFGLSAFIVEQRSKEISVRLVLGASMNSIFRLLTGNFVKLVLISFIIATPVAWYLMTKWLEDYTYRIDVGLDVFALAGIMSVIIALLTVSYQSVRAALANPVERLRSE